MAVSLTGCGEEKVETEAVQAEAAQPEAVQTDGKQQVPVDSLGDRVAFIDYDSNGTAMRVMLYKGEDGTVRGALNTCQVCAGSPYAYFEQEGSDVVCQNCGNHFSVDDIGDTHGGCNPVPLEVSRDGKYTVIDTVVLDEQAVRHVAVKMGKNPVKNGKNGCCWQEAA